MNPEWLRYYIAAKLNDRVEHHSIPMTSWRGSTAVIGSTSISEPCGTVSDQALRGQSSRDDPGRTNTYAATMGVLVARIRSPTIRQARIREGVARDHAVADR
jgi:hypothetical protein